MKVLIIGGNRFFGRKLAQLCLLAGHDVTLINRGGLNDGLGNQVKRLICDRNDENRMHILLQDQKFDIVYDQVCFDAHQAAAACRIFKDKTKRYIFTSSMSVYPEGLGLSEFVFDPVHYKFEKVANFPPDYAEAKRQAEATFFQQKEFALVAVRFPIVMGLDDYTNRLKFHVEHVRRKMPLHFPNLDAKLSCINSDDAAKALFDLGSSNFHGPLNIATPEPIKLNEMMALIERLTNTKADYAATGDVSPYGITSDWTMDVTLAEQNKIRCAPLNTWFPDLVRQLL